MGSKTVRKEGIKIVWGKGMDFRNGAILDDEALGVWSWFSKRSGSTD